MAGPRTLDTSAGRHDNDGALVDAIARRDRAALCKAYNEHGGRVHAVARHLCGDAAADALTRDVFVHLWDNPGRYRADAGSLRSYLLLLVHRRAVDILRAHSASAAPAAAQTAPAAATAPRLTPIPARASEADVATLLRRAEVDEQVAALSAQEQLPILLAYFEGRPYRDVARLLGVTERTVKSRIRRGLRRIAPPPTAGHPSPHRSLG